MANMSIHQKCYLENFESRFLLESDNYFKRLGSKMINECSAPEYFKKAEDYINIEERRASRYLSSVTKPKLMEIIRRQLIIAHSETLLNMENSGLVPMFLSGMREDLGRMYKLYHAVDLHSSMANKIEELIRSEGLKILEHQAAKSVIDVRSYVESMLSLYTLYSSYMNNEFQKDHLFLSAVDKAFAYFINLDLVLTNPQSTTVISSDAFSALAPHKATGAELIASYCDIVLREYEKFEENLDNLFTNIVSIFSYLSDKDCFSEFYRRQLSKRLLVSNKSDFDSERLLISKLKMKMGAQFTSKLEGMIKDKTLSEELIGHFREYLTKKSLTLPFEFTPQILTTGFWPTFKPEVINVLEDFSKCMDTFKNFYDSRTESRSLKWIHSLGTCQILARYAAGDRDLLTNQYQAFVLMLFNNSTELTTDQIAESLQIPVADLKRNILALCASKNANILLKTGNPRNVAGDDVFSVNVAFSSNNRRIKIPNLVVKIDAKEREDIERTTQEDRKHAIEAAIVRIMKARKQLDHQNLVLETIKHLSTHFSPDPKIIKKRIEDLISRDYLERDSSKSNVYRYLA